MTLFPLTHTPNWDASPLEVIMSAAGDNFYTCV